MTGRKSLDDARRDAPDQLVGRHIRGDHRAGGDHARGADVHARENGGTGPDPATVADLDRPGRFALPNPAAGPHRRRRDHHDVMANAHVVADANGAGQVGIEAMIDDGVRPDREVPPQVIGVRELHPAEDHRMRPDAHPTQTVEQSVQPRNVVPGSSRTAASASKSRQFIAATSRSNGRIAVPENACLHHGVPSSCCNQFVILHFPPSIESAAIGMATPGSGVSFRSYVKEK